MRTPTISAWIFPLAIAVASLTACSDDDGDGGGQTVDEDAPVRTGQSAPDAPVIHYLAADTSTITRDDAATITAIVSDPDGIGDLVGGIVRSPDGFPYAPLAAGADEGVYTATLFWRDLHDLEPISIVAGDDGLSGGSRSVVVEFFDGAGGTNTALLSFDLSCTAEPPAFLGSALGRGVATGDPTRPLGDIGACENEPYEQLAAEFVWVAPTDGIYEVPDGDVSFAVWRHVVGCEGYFIPDDSNWTCSRWSRSFEAKAGTAFLIQTFGTQTFELSITQLE